MIAVRCPRCRETSTFDELEPQAEFFCVTEIGRDTSCDYPLFLAPTARTVVADTDPEVGRAVLPGEVGHTPLASRVCLDEACQTKNDRRAMHCYECGKPLDRVEVDDSAEKVRVIFQTTETEAPMPRWWRWRWWLLAGTGVLLIAVGFVIASLV